MEALLSALLPKSRVVRSQLKISSTLTPDRLGNWRTRDVSPGLNVSQNLMLLSLPSLNKMRPDQAKVSETLFVREPSMSSEVAHLIQVKEQSFIVILPSGSTFLLFSQL